MNNEQWMIEMAFHYYLHRPKLKYRKILRVTPHQTGWATLTYKWEPKSATNAPNFEKRASRKGVQVTSIRFAAQSSCYEETMQIKPIESDKSYG